MAAFDRPAILSADSFYLVRYISSDGHFLVVYSLVLLVTESVGHLTRKSEVLGSIPHGNPTDMRESTSVFQIRTINWSKLDK